MIRSLAKSGYQFAKRSPLLRRIARTPVIARLKSRVAPWVLLGDSEYERWMANRLTTRHLDHPCHPDPGLLSLLTTAWNTPPQYLQILSDSVLQQRGATDFEWIVLDNGSTKPATRRLLEEIAASDPRVRLLRVEENLGIVGGMRLALEQATGRYVLPVDSDDYLYPDCLQVVTSCLQRHDHPAILYSDEDHLLGRKFVLPYFKPDWDPVLFQSCAYIAHLGVFDRQLALELGVFSDLRMNGCHDWDTFERFRQAGHVPRHIPEVLYSWRMHSGSTAANINSKAYIRKSHRALLTGVLQ
ncbi:MAG: glycosyltransferase, partial [Planctomycetales bacterium]|nr:glycosyltransferase [Planctomycetales bacterium]